MKKRLFTLFGSMCLVFILTALPFMAAYAQQTKPMELKIAHMQPPVHFNHILLQEWAKRIEQQTGGKVHFTIYPVGTLVPPLEIYEALIKGVMDVGLAPDGYAPARFPLQIGTAQCMLGLPSAEVGARIRMEIWKKFPAVREEFKDSHVLALNVHGPANIHSRSPARTLQDFKGWQLRSPPGVPPWMKALGAVPVAMSMDETYLSIQKGITQGYTGPDETLKSFRLAEVTKYTSVIKYYTGAFFLAMNLKTWERLPPDVKKVIEGLNEWLNVEMAKGWDDIDLAAQQFAKGVGHEFISPTPEALKEIYNSVRPVHDAWAADMEAKGKPGKAIVAEIYELMKKYVK